MVVYVCMATFNLYGLMYPLTFVDLTAVPPEQMVNPLWEIEEKLHMKVYLSSSPKFGRSFLDSEFAEGAATEGDTSTTITTDSDTALLWKQDITAASLSKTFLLTSLECAETQTCENENDPSYTYAQEWLDHTDRMLLHQGDGVLSTIQSAGQGIESTSILLTFYQAISEKIVALFSMLNPSEDFETESDSKGVLQRTNVYLSKSSRIWKNLMSNSTVHIHVVVMRQKYKGSGAQNPDEAAAAFSQASRSNSILAGQVGLVKFDEPNHLAKPGRYLHKDLMYLIKRYVLMQVDEGTRPPWDMEFSKPEYYEAYQQAQQMKEEKAGYPYWKPEVAVKYLIDTDSYPYNIAQASGMSFVQVAKSPSHPVGVAHIPALHVDEIGLTSEKYVPLNETITSLPLHITFDRSDMKDENKIHATTATAGGISPARWRLLTHLSQSIESQKQLGFEQSDIDDLRRLIADTNVTLLGITVLASALHLLFEFLTFKNEVSFWKNNTDLTGLSVRSLFLDMMGQVIIVLYLIEKDSSLLMIIPSAIGCLIALWKCQRAAGLSFVKVSGNRAKTVAWWNLTSRLIGYELRATRLQVGVGVGVSSGSKEGDSDQNNESAPGKEDLHALSLECDRIATKHLGRYLLPLVFAYTLYSFFMEEHSGWYSWLIISASSAVYALGFALMTPQLFLNYKLKSVAHLPWRVLVYKSLNTFIDDLFSFIIRMPTMARISCFRDDVVFFIYLYQRWLYPVDTSRPVEGGGDGMEAPSKDPEAKKNR